MKYLLMIYLCWFSWLSGYADQPYGFHIANGKRFARIPFELHANLILISVKINNSDTLKFILDTGVSSTIITDPNIAKKLNLLGKRQVKISGAGEGTAIMATVSLDNFIQLGDVMDKHHSLVILNEDFLGLSTFVGVPVHGIIGYELFERFVITLDFLNKQVVIESPETFQYKTSKGVKIPITIEDNKPYVNDIQLIESSNKKIPLKLMIDTGAGHAVSLDITTDNRLRLPNNTVRSQLGRGLNGVISGYIGRIDGVLLNNAIMLKDIIASFPDSAVYIAKINNELIQRNGNIGCDLLRRFRVTFNYSENYMLLKPYKVAIKQSFEYNMTGIEIAAKGDDFHDFYVSSITPESPAQLAGIEKGDQILLINNMKAIDITLSDIYKLFQKENGKTITLLLNREGIILVVSFKLRRLI